MDVLTLATNTADGGASRASRASTGSTGDRFVEFGVHQGLVVVDAAVARACRYPRRASRRRRSTGAQEGDAPVTAPDQQVHAAGRPDIVGDHGVDVGADRRAIQAHDGGAPGDDRTEVRLVDRGGDDEQCHDAPLHHRRDDLDS